MLRDGNARGRDDDGRGRRDVPGADAVATGADNVDGIGGRSHLKRTLTHDGCACRDFLDGFAADAQPQQKGRDLSGRLLAGHAGLECGARRGSVERLALGEPRDDGLEVGHCPRVSLRPVRACSCPQAAGNCAGCHARVRTRYSPGGTARHEWAAPCAACP